MTAPRFFSAIESGGTTTEDALSIFDSLDPVDVDFMLGEWKGSGFPTGHPLDGVLEAYRWYGKHVDSVERVHPLVFQSLRGRKVGVDPSWFGPALGLIGRLPIPKSPFLARVFQLFLPLLSTRRSRARLRTTVYRGKSTATVIYDDLPIDDLFMKVDRNTVMGLMDMKGMQQPFFFVLRRATGSA